MATSYENKVYLSDTRSVFVGQAKQDLVIERAPAQFFFSPR